MMKISEMIEKLEQIKKEHGDIDTYATDGCFYYKCNSEYSPSVKKIYHQKVEFAGDEMSIISEGEPDCKDEELYGVDLSQPIKKAVIIS